MEARNLSRSAILVAALLAGVVGGVLVRPSGSRLMEALASGLAPLGQLWIRALQMTLVPLIFAIVASSVVAPARAGQGGRLLTIAAAPGLVALRNHAGSARLLHHAVALAAADRHA